MKELKEESKEDLLASNLSECGSFAGDNFGEDSKEEEEDEKPLRKKKIAKKKLRRKKAGGHNNGELYKCDFCDYEVQWKYRLRKHKEKLHWDQLTDEEKNFKERTFKKKAGCLCFFIS